MRARWVHQAAIGALLATCGVGLGAQANGGAAPRTNVMAKQSSPARRGGAVAPVTSDALTNDQVYQLLDAFVMTRAQAALQLNDAQFSAFFQRMLRLQTIQRQHRRQRQRVLAELRQLVGPRAAESNDEAVAAKTKELDDLEAKMTQDEGKALADIDQVLQVRQRAHLRIFLETMERQKLELLIKARQNAGTPAPSTAARSPVE